MKRFLVTGGAGFLGSHLCKKLLTKGHQVVCLDNLVTGRKENLSDLLCPQLEFIEADVCQVLKINGALDGIFHLASPASPVDFHSLALEILKVNSLGSLKMLELAREKEAAFLLASTSEVYGDPLSHPQTEDYRGNVNTIGERSPYDEGKRFAEALTATFNRLYQLPVRIVRIFNTYGPKMRKDDGRVIPSLISAALLNRELTLYGDGKQTRSFCYVDDLIEGIYRLFFADYCLPVNLGNDREYTMLELAEIIRELTGSKGELKYLPLPPDDPRKRKPDLTKARQLLSWEPKTDLKTGLNSTIGWFKNNP